MQCIILFPLCLPFTYFLKQLYDMDEKTVPQRVY